MLRCPVCKAENTAGPACRRCKADLSLLFAVEEQRAWALAEARRCLFARRWRAARAHAQAAHELRRDDESGKLVAVTALLCRDFDAAWRAYREVRASGG
jgi:hypothetical protein